MTSPATLWAARAAPYGNPYEGHPYSSLPLCRPGGDINLNTKFIGRSSTLGQLMGGYAWEPIAQLPPYPTDMANMDANELEHTQSCTSSPLTSDQAQRLSDAIQNRWFYQFWLEDLPTWGMLGEWMPDQTLVLLANTDKVKNGNKGAEPYSAQIYRERTLTVYLTNDHEIMQVDLTSDPGSLAKVEAERTYTFTLNIRYLQTGVREAGKYDRYLDHSFFQHSSRTFGAINGGIEAAFVLFVVVVGLIRILKFNSQSLTKEMDANKGEVDAEKGTALTEKLLPKKQSQPEQRLTVDPADAFAPPDRVELLSALLGNGWHLLAFGSLMILCFQNTSPLEFGPSGRTGWTIWGYVATSGIAGFCSAYYYQQQQARTKSGAESDRWKMAALLTLLIPPFIMVPVLSAIALASLHGPNSIDVISKEGAFRLLILWIFAVVPLNLLGVALGRLHQGKCGNVIEEFTILAVPPPKRALDKKLIAKGRMLHFSLCAFLGSFLAFSVMFVHLYYAMTAMWNYKFYVFSWRDMVVPFLALLITAALGICSITLSVKGYPGNDPTKTWQWYTFVSPAGTGVFVFLYAIYHYIYRLQMHGLFSAIHYFGHMLIISIGVTLVGGSVAHFAAYRCLKLLYTNIKAA